MSKQFKIGDHVTIPRRIADPSCAFVQSGKEKSDEPVNAYVADYSAWDDNLRQCARYLLALSPEITLHQNKDIKILSAFATSDDMIKTSEE